MSPGLGIRECSEAFSRIFDSRGLHQLSLRVKELFREESGIRIAFSLESSCVSPIVMAGSSRFVRDCSFGEAVDAGI